MQCITVCWTMRASNGGDAIIQATMVPVCCDGQPNSAQAVALHAYRCAHRCRGCGAREFGLCNRGVDED